MSKGAAAHDAGSLHVACPDGSDGFAVEIPGVAAAAPIPHNGVAVGRIEAERLRDPGARRAREVKEHPVEAARRVLRAPQSVHVHG